MFILTGKLVYHIAIVSSLITQETNQYFLRVILLLLPSNTQIEQYRYFSTLRSNYPPNIRRTDVLTVQLDVQTGKQEPEELYSILTHQGHTGCFFMYITPSSKF